jgi:hypothetical protein
MDVGEIMIMKFKVVAREGDKIGQVVGEVKGYPRTPMRSLVDILQEAMLEAGFSFDAEILDMQFEDEEEV